MRQWRNQAWTLMQKLLGYTFRRLSKIKKIIKKFCLTKILNKL